MARACSAGQFRGFILSSYSFFPMRANSQGPIAIRAPKVRRSLTGKINSIMPQRDGGFLLPPNL
jgi:hypothetical protein